MLKRKYKTFLNKRIVKSSGSRRLGRYEVRKIRKRITIYILMASLTLPTLAWYYFVNTDVDYSPPQPVPFKE